jgi:hypothetical protein
MLKLIKALFNLHAAKKENPIAAAVEIKETSASRWWS